MYIVYKISNKANNKLYIGVTSRPIKERFTDHCAPSSRCIGLSRSIKKYGKHNFTIKSIVRCDHVEQAIHRERLCIRLFNSLSPNGYNLKDGDYNGKFSKEVCNKISSSLLGKEAWNKGLVGTDNPLFGRKRKRSIIKKIAKANRGKKRNSKQVANIAKAMIGISHSENTKRKISSSMKKICSSRPQEQYIKMSRTKTGKPIKKLWKSIICVETGEIYKSIGHASSILKISRASISRVLNNKQNSVKNLTFIFK